MSMRDYGLSDVGLVIADEITAYIVLAADKANGRVPESVLAAVNDGTFRQKVLDKHPDIPADYLDISIAQEILEMMDIETVHCSEFTGSAVTLHLPGDDETIPRTWDYQDRFMAYIPAQKASSLFEPAYNHPDDLVKEFRNALNSVLPENFNVRPYIVEIEGSYCA